MKKRYILLIIALFLSLGMLAYLMSPKMEESIQYQCDVKSKLFHRFATTIEIDKEGEDFVKVRGNTFKFVTDPLTMYNLDKTEIAYAGDSYHFFAQDSHTIYVDGNLSVEMVGLIRPFGEAYDIYNSSGEKIAFVSFGPFNTHGYMYDMEDNLIASFHSFLFFRDFTVRISESCPIDEKTALMIFCSYYSDQAFDSANSSSHSNNH